MRNLRRAALLTAPAVAGLLLLTACGSDGKPAATSAPTAAAAPATPAPATSAPAADPAVLKGSLAAGNTAKSGAIVLDGLGYTLYRFDKDTAAPSASNCNGDCAAKWPPVPVNAKSTAKGIDAKLVGSVTRADGTEQLTLGGWPLYRFAGDKAPGETNGQGVGGTWFIAAPDGKKAAATTGTGGNGY
jgi:predicted lipoprotein with Yx(FWY)xxD motif